MKDIRQLPAVIKRQIPGARLPINYEAAKKALQACVLVDEAKDWADRAAAIASYARQIQDKSLQDMARRIELRATRRIGELIEDAKPFPNKEPAKAAGMTESKINAARKISRLDESKFNAIVERPDVPSVNQLSGSIRLAGGSYIHTHSETYEKLHNMLRYFEQRWLENSEGKMDLPELTPSETEMLRTRLIRLMEWLDKLEQRLRPTHDAKEGPQ
jgi:hypothetical protein